MKVLVTGGAGYVGGAVALALKKAGHSVTILDNFTTGAYAVPGCRIVRGDVCDMRECAHALGAGVGKGVDAVCHLAAVASVPESFKYPDKYWLNNVEGTRVLLQAMRACKVTRLIFSSTAAVYEHTNERIGEESPKNPVTPYGQSKLAAEWMVENYKAYGLSPVVFRYFNVVGAVRGHGEDRSDEKHILPLLLSAAKKGKKFCIYGRDFLTSDGTCVRDYVHVDDIARAHVLALERPDEAFTSNVASGTGTSNEQLLRLCEKLTGKQIKFRYGPARLGDPARLVAERNPQMARIGWAPKRSLDDAVKSTWRWLNREK